MTLESDDLSKLVSLAQDDYEGYSPTSVSPRANRALIKLMKILEGQTSLVVHHLPEEESASENKKPSRHRHKPRRSIP